MARKVFTNTNITSANTNSGIIKPAGTGFIGRGKSMNNNATRATSRAEFCSDGVQNLRLSNPNRDFERGSQQPQNYNVWTRKSNPQDKMYDSAAGRGRGQNVYYDSYAAGTSLYGRERGQNANYGNSGAATQMYGRGRGQNVNYGNSGAATQMYGRGRGQNVNYGDGGAAAGSVHGRGKDNCVNTGNSAAAPSEHSGRGQHINYGNSGGMNWNPRKYNGNQGADRDSNRW